jgi:hypothetical protein
VFFFIFSLGYFASSGSKDFTIAKLESVGARGLGQNILETMAFLRCRDLRRRSARHTHVHATRACSRGTIEALHHRFTLFAKAVVVLFHVEKHNAKDQRSDVCWMC